MRLCVWLSEQAEFLFRPSPSPAQSRPKRFGAAPGLTLRGRSSKPSPKRQFSKRRKNSSDGPLSSRSGTELFTRSGGGRRSPAFPNHIRKIPIIHLFAGYTETRPDNKTLRKNGRQFLSPKIARPPYPSRENHGSFSPGTARDFQSESPPTVPHLEKRKPAASLGKRRQYPDSTGHSPMQAATRRIVGKVPSRLLRTCSGVHHRARSIPSSRCGAGCVQPTMRMRNQCVRLSSQLP